MNPHILLASKSPRRQELIKGLQFPFTIVPLDVDESFPEILKGGDIAAYLAKKKAEGYLPELEHGQVLLTCDTIVWIQNSIMNKPLDREEAIGMLTKLSGNMHQVFTGVCLRTREQEIIFYDETKVWFHTLTKKEIEFYVDTFKPLDKAGAYGIQEYIGYIGIQKIEGCFYNVMGMPVSRVYEGLKRLIG